MNKKVFFIMSTNDFSGAENVNFSIIDGLKEKYDFYWVSKKGNINRFLDERKIKWIEIKELSVGEIRRVIKQFKPDILHATDYKASVISAIAKKNNKHIKLIEHLHNNSSWLKKISINSIAFLYAGLKADEILTVSESIEREYIFSNLISKKIRCIGNPVSRDNILKMVSEKDFEKIYDVCCVARIVKEKIPFKFLDIIADIRKQIPNVNVIWIGKGELEEDVLKKTEELDLKNNVKFLGFKKNPYKYIAHSKVFMLTSDIEGYGLVAFEALTLGVPCVVSKIGGLPSVVDETCGKLCMLEEEFVNETLKLLKDKKFYQIKSNNAIKKSIKIENLNEYIDIIDKIYNI